MAAKKKESKEGEADFVVEGELETGKSPRRIRVYNDNGDYFLDVPAGVRITFGYFNPAAPQEQYSGRGYGGPGSQTMRTTALRIYADSTDKRQLACFLGVKGFRDETIKLTQIVQKVTIESKLVDDGEGTVEYGGKQLRELSAAPEKEF